MWTLPLFTHRCVFRPCSINVEKKTTWQGFLFLFSHRGREKVWGDVSRLWVWKRLRGFCCGKPIWISYERSSSWCLDMKATGRPLPSTAALVKWARWTVRHKGARQRPPISKMHYRCLVQTGIVASRSSGIWKYLYLGGTGGWGCGGSILGCFFLQFFFYPVGQR